MPATIFAVFFINLFSCKINLEVIFLTPTKMRFIFVVLV